MFTMTINMTGTKEVMDLVSPERLAQDMAIVTARSR